jgi:hypothetical protein
VVKDKEIDFVCQKFDRKIYIQVSYRMQHEDTKKREFSPLLEVNDKYESYVLSMDEENMSQDGIRHMNIIDFLKSDDF